LQNSDNGVTGELVRDVPAADINLNPKSGHPVYGLRVWQAACFSACVSPRTLVRDHLTLMDKAAYLEFVLEIIRRRGMAQGFEVLPRR